MKNIRSIPLLLLSLLILVGLSGCGTDYTNCFSFEPAEVVTDLRANEIAINYTISNVEEDDDLTFIVTVGEESQAWGVSAGETVSDCITIDVGRLTDDYQYKYEIKCEVLRDSDGKELWTKTISESCDCRTIFIHPAEITYKGETVAVELVDYQINYFDLTTLFSAFDDSKVHAVNLENWNNDMAKIQASTESEDGNAVNEGGILRVITAGQNEVCDTYHYTNDLKIIISDGVRASDVDWASNMEFRRDANYRESMFNGNRFLTWTMYVDIKNPSDETVSAYVSNFYVNDTPISEAYLVGTLEDSEIKIKAHETDSVYTVTSGSVWVSTGVENVKKFGMEVVILNQDGETVYTGTSWIDL